MHAQSLTICTAELVMKSCWKKVPCTGEKKEVGFVLEWNLSRLCFYHLTGKLTTCLTCCCEGPILPQFWLAPAVSFTLPLNALLPVSQYLLSDQNHFKHHFCERWEAPHLESVFLKTESREEEKRQDSKDFGKKISVVHFITTGQIFQIVNGYNLCLYIVFFLYMFHL